MLNIHTKIIADLLIVLALIITGSCANRNTIETDDPGEENGIFKIVIGTENDPVQKELSVKIADKADEYVMLVSYNDDLSQNGLWLLDKKNKTFELMLNVDHRIDMSDYYSDDNSVRIRNSISCIDYVEIIDPESESPKVIVEAMGNGDNDDYTFVVTRGQDSILFLPGNAGYLGLTSERDRIITKSVVTTPSGLVGNIIKVFDLEGNFLSSLDASAFPENQ